MMELLADSPKRNNESGGGLQYVAGQTWVAAPPPSRYRKGSEERKKKEKHQRIIIFFYMNNYALCLSFHFNTNGSVCTSFVWMSGLLVPKDTAMHYRIESRIKVSQPFDYRLGTLPN